MSSITDASSKRHNVVQHSTDVSATPTTTAATVGHLGEQTELRAGRGASAELECPLAEDGKSETAKQPTETTETGAAQPQRSRIRR